MLSLLEREVTTHASGMAKKLLEAQTAVVGTFTSISAAILGVVDRVAQADQGYRLMGLRMMASAESARKLDMVTKSLGATLGEIFWDPELRARASGMFEDIDRMTEHLPANFEKSMKGVRDFRNEFARLEQAVKFIGMGFAARLFDKLIPGDAKDKIHNFVTWLEDHIGVISDKLSDYAVPILRKTWEILVSAGEAAKSFGLMFTNIIGLLSGDTSIQGATFDFDKLAKAIGHVGDAMKAFFDWMSHAEQGIAHFVSALSLLLSGQFEAAKKELLSVLDQGGGLPGSVIGGVLGSALGPVGTAAGAAAGGAIGAWLAAPAEEQKAEDHKERPTPTEAPASAIETIDQAPMTPPQAQGSPKPAPQQGFPQSAGFVDSLASAIARVEAGNKPNPVSERNNNPGNLRSWGSYPIVNGFVRFPNRETGLEALRQQISKNISRGLTLNEFFAGKPGVYPGFAPAKDNNHPDKYAGTVANWLDIDPSIPLKEFVGKLPAVSAAKETTIQQEQPADRSRPLPEQSLAPVARFMSQEPPVDRQTPERFSAPDILNRDWAPTLAALQTPHAPAPQYTNNHQATSVDVGGIYITQPGADAHTIETAVARGIQKGLGDQTRFDLTQLSPAFG